MKFVLFLLITAHAGNVDMTTQTFSDLTACESALSKARTAIYAAANLKNVDYGVSGFCAPDASSPP